MRQPISCWALSTARMSHSASATTTTTRPFNSFYAQDEFKVNPRLTLTYGLRYEPFLPWKDRNDRINTVVPGAQSKVVPDAPPGILFPGDVPKGLASADLNNFAPRVGLAWDVFGRSGKPAFAPVTASITRASTPIPSRRRTHLLPVLSAHSVATSPIHSDRRDKPRHPPLKRPLRLRPDPGVSVLTIARCSRCRPAAHFCTGQGLRSPYVQEFNFSIQRQDRFEHDDRGQRAQARSERKSKLCVRL